MIFAIFEVSSSLGNFGVNPLPRKAAKPLATMPKNDNERNI